MKKELKHQALIELFTDDKINLWESLGVDAVAGDNEIAFNQNLVSIEKQLKSAIIDDDSCALGKVMMDLFTQYQASSIDAQAQELEVEYHQNMDDLHNVPYVSPQQVAMQDAGMSNRDFF